MSGLEKVSRKEMEEFIFGHPIGDPEAEEDDSEYYILRPKEEPKSTLFYIRLGDKE